LRILDTHRSARAQDHVLPQADVAVANPWDPVPTFRRDERRTVDRERAPVLAGAGRDRLFVRNPGMRRRVDLHSERILLARLEFAGDIEDAADERALDVP